MVTNRTIDNNIKISKKTEMHNHNQKSTINNNIANIGTSREPRYKYNYIGSLGTPTN